jgi:hypothetical protein
MSFAIAVERGQDDPELVELTFYRKLQHALLGWQTKRLDNFILETVVCGLLWKAKLYVF